MIYLSPVLVCIASFPSLGGNLPPHAYNPSQGLPPHDFGEEKDLPTAMGKIKARHAVWPGTRDKISFGKS